MKPCAQKWAVDTRVSVELGLPAETVAAVTSAFLASAAAMLVEYGALELSGLGRLRVRPPRVIRRPQGSTRIFSLRIKMSPELKTALAERNREVPYGQVRSGRVGP